MVKIKRKQKQILEEQYIQYCIELKQGLEANSCREA